MAPLGYFRPERDPQTGRPLTYEERSAKRRQNYKPTPLPPVLTAPQMSDSQRSTIREQVKQGHQEAQSLAAIQESARQAALDASIPEHERRPMNPWTRLIKEWQSQSFRPDVARKIKDYRRLEKIEEAKIDAIMDEKARVHAISTNPETIKARSLLATVAAGATPEEEIAIARCQGLIDAGVADAVFDAIQPIVESRLQRIRAAIVDQAERKSALDASYSDLAEKEKAMTDLLPEPEAEPEPEPTTETIE
jgi:hypothetical protein